MSDSVEKRPEWSGRMTFITAAVGSAIGLGNVWRFPYTAYQNGGGAFLIPYLIALFICGIPLLILELGMGQMTRSGAITAWRRQSRKWEWIGWYALFSSLMIVFYYAVIMSWSLVFLWHSMKALWGSLFGHGTALPWQGHEETFFFSNVLDMKTKEGGEIINTVEVGHLGKIVWPVVIGLVITWAAIWYSIRRGVHSVGKIVWVTVTLPLVILIVLLIRGLTLKGASDGIAAFLNPDFSKLKEFKVWQSAFGQIFFSLSVGFGIMIAYASHQRRDAEITNTALMTALLNSAFSFLAGLTVFSCLGFLAMNRTDALKTTYFEQKKALTQIVHETEKKQEKADPITVTLADYNTILSVNAIAIPVDSVKSALETGEPAAFEITHITEHAVAGAELTPTPTHASRDYKKQKKTLLAILENEQKKGRRSLVIHLTDYPQLFSLTKKTQYTAPVRNINTTVTNSTSPFVRVDQVLDKGPGLAFVVFPAILSQLPGHAVTQAIFALLFFLMLFSLGIDSAFSIVEGIVVAVHDRFGTKIKRGTLTIGLCVLGLIGGLLYCMQSGLWWLDIVDHWINNMGILFVGLLEVIVLAWIVKSDRLKTFVSRVSELPIGKVWEHIIAWDMPRILFVMMLLAVYQDISTPYSGYPAWMLWTFGWGMIGTGIILSLVLSALDYKQKPRDVIAAQNMEHIEYHHTVDLNKLFSGKKDFYILGGYILFMALSYITLQHLMGYNFHARAFLMYAVFTSLVFGGILFSLIVMFRKDGGLKRLDAMSMDAVMDLEGEKLHEIDPEKVKRAKGSVRVEVTVKMKADPDVSCITDAEKEKILEKSVTEARRSVTKTFVTEHLRGHSCADGDGNTPTNSETEPPEHKTPPNDADPDSGPA